MEKNQQIILQNLEKRNSVNKSIIQLQNSKGESIRNQNQILEETLSFYAKLYESRDDKLNLEEFDQHLLRSDFPNLTEVKLRALEGRLSVRELLAVLKKISNMLEKILVKKLEKFIMIKKQIKLFMGPLPQRKEKN